MSRALPEPHRRDATLDATPFRPWRMPAGLASSVGVDPGVGDRLLRVAGLAAAPRDACAALIWPALGVFLAGFQAHGPGPQRVTHSALGTFRPFTRRGAVFGAQPSRDRRVTVKPLIAVRATRADATDLGRVVPACRQKKSEN